MGRGGLKERGRGTGIRDRGTRMGEMWSADVIWRLGDGRWSTDGIHRQPHIKKKTKKYAHFHRVSKFDAIVSIINVYL